jgi:ATPases of the AAA+ class
VIVFLDEIEKAFAGTGTDLSGVKTEMTGTMLTWMQDNEADGLIFIGPPGAAKRAVAKATGEHRRNSDDRI